ncbi:hypothetical protein [Legionella rowbothamii]|uniref:hypothetical protein n=1 Tax=Legionella rowbothamii TaxID=96229 RepID=UPI001054D990|nr:hypothetical protein [Legionella rowbothamii]
MQKLMHHVNSMSRLFLFSVVIPILLSIIYFGLIASEVSVVESQFVIRDSQQKTMNGLDSMLSHSGLMSGSTLKMKRAFIERRHLKDVMI